MLLQIQEPSSKSAPADLQEKIAIGIDLGTTNSVAAYVTDGQVQLLTNLIPSTILYGDKGYTIGQPVNSNQQPIISSIKSLMGKNFADIKGTAQEKLYPIAQDLSDKIITLRLNNNQLTNSTEISAQILAYIKNIAEQKTGHIITDAVITVPAYFDDAARTATKDAARVAGLNVLRLLNEPTAAALAYGLEKNDHGLYGIYDLGGGTFDFSLLKFHQGIFQVIASSGDTNLGGDNFDYALLDYIIANNNIQITDQEYKHLLPLVKQAKETLSSADEAVIDLHSYKIKITQQEFNKIIKHFITKTIKICQDAITAKNIDVQIIQGIVLIGGSTRIPFIKTAITQQLHHNIYDQVDPDRTVAMGAAIQAYTLANGQSMIKNNADANEQLSPLLMDITPLSLGVETMGGIVDRIIERNSPIPLCKTKEFTTYQDNQTGMIVKIVQGEREMAQDCRTLGMLELKNIPPMHAGMAKVSITFQLDADGLLTVTAKEKTTGNAQEIAIKPSYGLDHDTLQEMIIASLQHAERDVNKKLLTQSKIDALRIINYTRSAVQDDKELLSQVEYNKIMATINALERILENGQKEEIELYTKKLEIITKNFADKRMNTSINKMVKGKKITDINTTD